MRQTLVRHDWRAIAVLASIGAAGIHFGAARAHLGEYLPAGLFMLLAGVAQFGWALWVARGAPAKILETGMAANAGIVALWVASRTIGLPLGEMPGVPEHVHGTDIVATSLEIVIVLGVLGAESARTAPTWMLAVTVLGVLATLIVSGDDPSRERLVAGATIVLAAATWAVGAALARTFNVHLRRRSHAPVTFARPAVLGVGAPARAGGGARG